VIRLITKFGSKERDEDILVVVDDIKEAFKALSEIVIINENLDLHVVDYLTFLRLLKEDPFYVNVLINGEHVINAMKIDNMNKIIEEAISKARQLVGKQCREGKNGISLAYYYLISRGIFPRNRHDVKNILGKDKGDDFSFICTAEDFNTVKLLTPA
jgi:hypothetical protein